MGLTQIVTKLDKSAEQQTRCVVGKAKILLLTHDPEAVAELVVLLEQKATRSGQFIADVLNVRFNELLDEGVLAEPVPDIQAGSVQNHRRKGCTCGTL